MSRNTFPAISPYEDDRQARDKINQIQNGRLNATGDMTVGSGTGTTVVQDKRVTGFSVILLMPKDAASADTSSFYLSAQDAEAGTFTFTHTSGVTRNYSYVIIG